MKFKSVVLLAVALGCGLVAMLGVQQVLSSDKKPPQEETVPVLVATADIAPGVPLDKSNTIFKKWPKGSAPEGAVTSAEQYEERSLTSRAVPGEMIMLAKLGEKGVFGASSEIPEGMRVVTVSVNLTKTHSGLIRPGDRVDVMVTYKLRNGSQGMISKTRTVLEFIKVFAADHLRAGAAADNSEINAKNISLLVDPEQAHLLMLAESKGQLHLALRHKTDNTPGGAKGVDERIFDEIEAKFGEADADGGARAPTAEAEPTPPDVRDFLSQQLSDTESVVERPKWKIQIYAGREQRVQEVEDLPDEPAVDSVPAADAPAAPGGDSGWPRLLRQFLIGV